MLLLWCKFYVLSEDFTLHKIKNSGKCVAFHSVSVLRFVLHKMKYSDTVLYFIFSYGWLEFQYIFIFK